MKCLFLLLINFFLCAHADNINNGSILKFQFACTTNTTQLIATGFATTDASFAVTITRIT